MKYQTRTAQACADVLDELDWVRAEIGVPTSAQKLRVRNGMSQTLPANLIARWEKNGIYLQSNFFQRKSNEPA